MLLNYHNLFDHCIPLTIAPDDQPAWGKIGGCPPRGVIPAVVTESTRYFATIKSGTPDQAELSFFISADYEKLSPANMLKNRHKIHSADNSLVQFVFHPPAPRGEDTALASELSGHGLLIEDRRPDSDDLESDVIWNHHKLGGYPFYTRFKNPIVDEAKALARDEYLHLVQFAFPDSQDGRIRGTWPFFDLVFHVFAKDLGGRIDFRYGWG